MQRNRKCKEGIDGMKLHEMKNGDSVHRYDDCITLVFNGVRKVLSTSIYNGGIHEDFSYVYNHSVYNKLKNSCMTSDTYIDYMKDMAIQLGLEPEKGSGMATAAFMERVAIAERSYKELTVTAIVTAGIDGNGGRVGDPASYYNPLKKGDKMPTGTINIMLYIDAVLPDGILERALITCTEAKTAALQELMAGSVYSTGIATGSGTDTTMIISNTESPLFFDSAGKHSKLGELIGQSVKWAVKDALFKQTRLGPKKQYDVFRRLKRYGIEAEDIYEMYEKAGGTIPKYEGIQQLEHWARTSTAVRKAVAIIHAIDEWQWNLLLEEDVWETMKDCGLDYKAYIGDEQKTATPHREDVLPVDDGGSKWTIHGQAPLTDEEKAAQIEIFKRVLRRWILEQALPIKE